VKVKCTVAMIFPHDNTKPDLIDRKVHIISDHYLYMMAHKWLIPMLLCLHT